MWQNSRSTCPESRFLADGGIRSTPQKRKLSALSSFSSTIRSKINTQRSMFTFSIYSHFFSHLNSNLCIFLLFAECTRLEQTNYTSSISPYTTLEEQSKCTICSASLHQTAVFPWESSRPVRGGQ